MAQKFDLQNNIALTSTKKVAKISKPLSTLFNINYFRYIRLYNDGTRFTLCNQPEVVRYFYEKGNYPLAWYDQAKPIYLHQSGLIPWVTKRVYNSEEQQRVATEMKTFFNIAHGNAYVDKCNNFVEIYDFGSNYPEIYTIDKNILKRFKFYFREQARKLIEHAQSEKILVPLDNDFATEKPSNNKEKLFEKIVITKRYYLSGALEGVYLTDREVECLTYCCNGKSAKEIAILLSISKRTVDRHLDNIKHKLKCYKQSQLIKTAIKQGIEL